MKNIVSILLVLVGFAANAQIQDYVIEASDSLITRGVLQIDTDKFKATTQVSSDDTTLVSLDYLTNLLDAAEYADSLSFHSGTGYLVYYRSGVALDSTSMDNRYLRLAGGTMANTNLVTNLNADLLDGIHGTQLLPRRAYSYTNGVLIKTDITSTEDAMIIGTIKTNSYFALQAGTISFQAYNYVGSNSIINVDAVSTGITPLMYIFVYNGYVYLWFAQTSTFHTFLVDIRTGYQTEGNRVIQITNEVKPTTGVTREVSFTPKKVLNNSNFVAGTHYMPAHGVGSNYLLKSDGMGGVARSQFWENVGGDEMQLFHNTSNENALILFPADYTAQSTGIYFRTNQVAKLKVVDGGSFIFSHSSADRMVIAPSGNVGIGHTDPQLKLEVNGWLKFGTSLRGSPYSIAFNSTGSPVSGRLEFGTDGSGYDFRIAKNQLGTITDIVTIRDGGYVGINYTTPSTPLNVNNRFSVASDGVVRWGLLGTNSSGRLTWDTDLAIVAAPVDLAFHVGGSYKMRVLNNGNVGIGTTAPAQKLDVNGNIRVRGVGTNTASTVLGLDSNGDLTTNVTITGGATWKGGWNASTNTPTLSDATGTNGWWYKVTVAGTQNLGSGSITFAVGDDVIHNGSVWEKFTVQVAETDPIYINDPAYGIASGDISNWDDAYNNRISTFTTTGNSGAATFTGNALNIPNYTLSGLGFTYPSAGIPISTGTGWGTSITNNSANWNTAYGWGNHATAGYLTAEVDGSISNEGNLTVGAGTATTSLINSNTSGSTPVTISASTGLSISESGNTITMTNTAPDQTVTLTQGGATTITGTYPNFTISSTDNNTTYSASEGIGASGTTFSLALQELNTGTPSTNNHWIPWVNSANNIHYRVGLLDLQGIAGYNAGKLQNVAIASTAPTTDYVLKYNGTQWAPAVDATGSTLTAGNAIVLAGDSINYKPTKVTATETNLNIANNRASIYTNFEYGGNLYRTTLGQLSDINIYNARSLQGNFVSSNSPTTGYVLKWNGSAWAPAVDETGGGGSGTVTSVGLSMPSIFTVSGSPVTTSGTLTATLNSQSQNLFLASPSGASGVPSFRGLTALDIPGIDASKISTGTLPVARGGTGRTSNTAYALMVGGTTTTGALQQVSGVGTAGQVLTSNGAGALPTWQAAPTGGGMTDPMTTAGDMIYRNISNVTTRLPRGTNGEILTLVSGVPSWEPKQKPTLQAYQVGYGDLGSELTGSDYFVFYEDASYSRLNIGGGTGTVTLKTVDMAINTSTPTTPVTDRASIYLDYKGNLTKWEAGGLPKPIESQQDSAFVASAIGGYGGSLDLTGSLGDGMYTYEITASAINLTGTIVNTYKYNLSFRFVSGVIVWQRFTEVYKNETNTNIGLDDTTPVEVEDIGLNCRVIVNLFSSVTVTNTHFSADAKRIAYKPE